MLVKTLRMIVSVAGALWLGGCGGGGSGGDGAPSRPKAYSTPVAVKESLSFSMLESSGQHACGTTTDGSTWCWGNNAHGELGTNASMEMCNGALCTGQPQRMDTTLRFVALSGALGAGFTCGLVGTGEAYCWGLGQGGQLGNGQRADSSRPLPVAGGLQFQRIRVAPSGLGACGQTSDGSIYCWGPLGLLYGNGQSGEGHDAPIRVDWGRTFVDFDLGEHHACGITAAGEAFCWGNNWYGQLGLGSAGGAGGLAQASTPQVVPGVSGLSAIVTGSDVSCALRADGAAFCWGIGSHTGSAAATGYGGTPTAVDGSLRFVSLHAGFLQACGLTADGLAYCWGENYLGELGNGTQVASPVPVKVQGDIRFATLSHRPSCGVSISGVAYCWGGNAYGQVGRAP